jgi:hypothetical protein
LAVLAALDTPQGCDPDARFFGEIGLREPLLLANAREALPQLVEYLGFGRQLINANDITFDRKIWIFAILRS